MTTPICTIDSTGIHRPDFSTILTYYENAVLGIYGADTYLGNDSQDGQFVGLFAAALNDANATAVAVYNSFSPATAQGTGLSSVVKINGIARKVPTYSTVDLLIVGQAGATILGGIAADQENNRWLLPSSVTIPPAGQITVTATAQNIGAVAAAPGDVTIIQTPTFGWQSVTNPAAAVAGLPVETDPVLRARQGVSTFLPATTPLLSLIGALAALSGIVRLRVFENKGDAIDANGIPGHALAVVIDGGDAALIGSTLFAKMGLGVGTYGTTSEIVTDGIGIPHTIKFFRPTLVTISYALVIKPLPGLTADIVLDIQNTLADWTNNLGIGNSLYVTRAYAAANLYGTPGDQAYEIISLTVSKNGGPFTTSDIAIAFNEASSTTATLVGITYTP